MNGVKAIGQRIAAVGGAVAGLGFMGILLAGASSAVGEDPGETAITDFGSKVTTYGTALIGVIVIGVGLMLAVKYIKKAGSKA